MGMTLSFPCAPPPLYGALERAFLMQGYHIFSAYELAVMTENIITCMKLYRVYTL